MLPLGRVLERFSAEISGLSDLAARLEAVIAQRARDETDEMNRRALQEFDLLVQSLEALSIGLKELSTTLPEDQIINIQEVLTQLQLRDIADRLLGNTAPGCRASRPNTELF